MNNKSQSELTSNIASKQTTDLVVIGIECTAHTLGVAIIKGKTILANEKDSYITEEGGMIPAKVAEHHVDVFDIVFKKALLKANITPKDIDIIAFSNSPGIGHTLRIGATFARSLAIRLNKPLIPVNHCIAHLEIGRLKTEAKDPILLYASGANTQIIAYESGKYRIFGETLDNGVGNFIDSFGRELGLGFPAGPQVEKLALQGKKYIKLPYSVKGMDVSFGGILTNLKHKINSGKYSKEDLCYSVQETVFAMLVEVTERALAHTCKTEVILGGGVACNKRLQEMCKIMCEERNAKSYCPENQFLVDNAAMIAWTGLLKYSSENKDCLNSSSINPYERTDDVLINYR
ncbi:MAG: bifunctional N(6)-L-threonylcarbamoyladenine synthase/serine/threonine protein kinase [Candidatus Woesearchaeota archaeon]|jgi:N6-L-threonylcarbamoyladenine synthase